MPKFSEKTIEEIKRKLTISDVMENYAHIESKGGSKWVKCPFHGGGNERTPSCKLDDDRGTFYCFSCKESGDIFSLVMKKEGLDFSSAVEMLAKKAGVTLEEDYSKGGEGKKRRDEIDTLYDLYSRLMSTFHYLLLNSQEAEGAREYLNKRGINKEMIEKFSLGYAPSNPSFLYSFLKKKNYTDEFLSLSGLFSQKNSKWPLFSNRIMFPIRDRQGRTIAFSGRDLSNSDRSPKYINSPDTLIYHKKETFFGLYEAKKTISEEKKDPILCEGNFDVVAMHQAGYTSAIASLGTSFTLEQCRNIKRYFPHVSSFHMLFDSDSAGQNSTLRAIMILAENSLMQFVHKLKSAKDASELLEKRGIEGVKEEFESCQTGFEYLVQNSLNHYDIKNARGKSDFVKSLSAYLNSCTSLVEKDSYILSLSSLLGTDEEAIKEDLKRNNLPTNNSSEENSSKGEVKSDSSNLSLDLYAMLYLANHRDLFKLYRTRIHFGDLENNLAQKLYMALENAMRDDIVSNELFLTYVNDDVLKDYVSSSFALDEYREERTEVMEEVIKRLTLRSLERKSGILSRQISMLNPSDVDALNEVMEKKLKIDSLSAKLKAQLASFDLRE